MNTAIATRYRMAPGAGHELNQRDRDAPDWDAVVARLIGPGVVPDDRERRRADARALRDAAQRAVDAIDKRISEK